MPGSGRCDRDVTPSPFVSELSAADAGQTLCLASGQYGVWQGTDKAITIRPQDGATPTMGIKFTTGDSGFTIDGGRELSRSPGDPHRRERRLPDIDGGAKDITIKNTDFAVGITIDGVTDANLVFDHNLHRDLSGHDYTSAVHLNYSSDTPSGVTVRTRCSAT